MASCCLVANADEMEDEASTARLKDGKPLSASSEEAAEHAAADEEAAKHAGVEEVDIEESDVPAVVARDPAAMDSLAIDGGGDGGEDSAEPADDCLPKFAELSLIEWLFEFTSLAEDIVSIFLFDEDRFPVTTMFLVFMLEPVADVIFKAAMKFTKTEWDDFSYDILSEVVQAWLFIHFSSYSALACRYFPIFCGVQILLLIVQKCVDLKAVSDDDEEDEGDQPGAVLVLQAAFNEAVVAVAVRAGLRRRVTRQPPQARGRDAQRKFLALETAGVAIFANLCASPYPFAMQWCQDNAPFRTQTTDIAWTLWFWSQSLALTFYLSYLKTTPPSSEAILASVGNEAKIAKLIWRSNKFLIFAFRAGTVTNLAAIYILVQCWIYICSGDIEEDYDRGLTIFYIILFTPSVITIIIGNINIKFIFDVTHIKGRTEDARQEKVTAEMNGVELTTPEDGAGMR